MMLLKPHKNDYLIIKHLCKLTQPELMQQVYTYLNNKYDKVWKTDYAVFAEGDIPVTLVAHLDTVFDVPPTDFYIDAKKGVLWSPEGLGADDRAGVFAILKLISLDCKPNIVFVTDEEIGCVGAQNVIEEYPKCPFKSNFIIELDRRGRDDCVFYNCANDEFEEYIESFGFVTRIGSFSDISVLAPAWGQAAVNLSIGYYNEHSFQEHLNVFYLFETLEKVMHIFERCDKHFEYIDAFKDFYNTDYSAWNYEFIDETELAEGAVTKCAFCNEKYQDYDIIPVDFNGRKLGLCLDCLTKANVQWCDKCNSLYYVSNEFLDEGLCYHCKEENHG